MAAKLVILAPATKRTIDVLLALVANELEPFADRLQEGDVLDREDMRFDGYGEAALVFINRRINARGLYLDAGHPMRFLVAKDNPR